MPRDDRFTFECLTCGTVIEVTDLDAATKVAEQHRDVCGLEVEER